MKYLHEKAHPELCMWRTPPKTPVYDVPGGSEDVLSRQARVLPWRSLSSINDVILGARFMNWSKVCLGTSGQHQAEWSGGGVLEKQSNNWASSVRVRSIRLCADTEKKGFRQMHTRCGRDALSASVGDPSPFLICLPSKVANWSNF